MRLALLLYPANLCCANYLILYIWDFMGSQNYNPGKHFAKFFLLIFAPKISFACPIGEHATTLANAEVTKHIIKLVQEAESLYIFTYAHRRKIGKHAATNVNNYVFNTFRLAAI